jgi:hypothetical protein
VIVRACSACLLIQAMMPMSLRGPCLRLSERSGLRAAPRWRRYIEAHHVAHLGHEVRVGGELEGLQPGGWRPNARQMRCTVETERPQTFAMPRELRYIVMERREVVLSGDAHDMVESDVRRYLTV